MASPLAHALAGLALVRASRGSRPLALLGGTAIANLPDLDLLPGILAGDFARYHHGPSHSVAAAAAVAIILPAIAPGRRRRARATALVGLLYLSHLGLDLLTYDGFMRDGVGLPLLWPVSDERLLAPVHLFFFGFAPDARGVVEGLGRVSNVWALVWEAALFALVGCMGLLLTRRGALRAQTAAALTALAGLLVSFPHLEGTVLGELSEPKAESAARGDSGSSAARGNSGSSAAAKNLGSIAVRGDRGSSAAAGDAVSRAPADLDRSSVPLSSSARQWIREHRDLIRRTADRLGVPRLALAGVVAAERTLLYDRYDEIVDALFRVYFITLTEEELRSWVALQESTYQRELSGGEDPGLRLLRSPYLWSVGPAQVSFRNVLFYEPRLARLDGRPKRPMRETVQAILSVPGSLEYAAVILLDAQEAYERYADLDLRARPGVLATLYHLGSPTRRALRLGEENRRRELRGERHAVPRLNFYGAFVERHQAELEALMRSGEP